LNSHFHSAIGNLNSVSGNLPHGGQYRFIQAWWQKTDAAQVSGERKMLWTITVILLVLWLLGVVGVYTVGAWIHILLVLAIISIIFNLMSGRRAL
jgi:hypothetical protein